uniref:Uncharacterized protein n=1 Tax=Cucumis melo TaxID=3656 RepID=A0A9I9DR54_CUCME
MGLIRLPPGQILSFIKKKYRISKCISLRKSEKMSQEDVERKEEEDLVRGYSE